MSKTTRKRLWPVALVSLAVFGVLAAMVALTVLPTQPAQAHECAPADVACFTQHASEGVDPNDPDHTHNTAPMAVGSIGAVSVTAGMMSSAMDVSDYFNDADAGDTLTYAATSSDAAIATAEIASDGPGFGEAKMLTITGVAAGSASVTVTATDGSGEKAMQSVMVTVMAPEPDAPDMIGSSSTSGGAGVELILTIQSLPMDAVDGSSVELYLEDDFQVPDTIDRGAVYFTVPDGDINQNNGGRVYSSYAVEIDDDDHFTLNKKDYSIRVFIPDMNNAEDSGYNGPTKGQTVNLVFTKAAGIKNPTEAGTHSVGYSLLGANAEANDGPKYSTKSGDASQALDSDGDPLNDEVVLGMHDDAAAESIGLKTLAKITLSDEDAGRGKEITITGSGFNNGTGAQARVLVSATAPSCMDVMTKGKKLGEAQVGSDDKFTITFTVHEDEFDMGAVNYICAADSEAGAPRFASSVKVFDLEGSITVSPASASYGDEITLKVRDAGAVSQIDIGPKHRWLESESDSNGRCTSGNTAGETRSDGTIRFCLKEIDGSDFIFDLPGGLDEQVQIAAKTEDGTKRVYLGVEASTLKLSQSEVAPNASIIISGSGFTENSTIKVSDITIDDEPLVVDEAGTEGSGDNRHVKVTSSGEFSATVRVWTASSSTNNPTLDDDTYTIKVVDSSDFEGEAEITIMEPTLTVTPDTASPRDFIVISGENWPISTADQDNSVTIMVDGRTRNADIGSTGRFRYEYQLRSGIKIGDEHEVTAKYEDGTRDDIEEETTFNVTPAGISISPAAAGPGQTISVEIEGMPPYTLVDEIRIDGANRLGNRHVNTDREGNATVSDILVPFLDPGFYPVEVRVGNETRVAQFEVLAEAGVPGVAMALPDAVAGLGDNLEAIFHFNNTSKEWSFFDPRPEFADLNTLTELNNGQPYWVLVGESQADVDWNGRLVNFTCAADDCWNLEIW